MGDKTSVDFHDKDQRAWEAVNNGDGEESIKMVSAVEADAQTIVALRKQIWATTYRGIYPDSMIDDFDDAWHLKEELQRIMSPACHVYRIIKEDRNIGYMSTRKTDVLWLQSLYILKEYQHQGIGRFAFDFLRKYCREHGENTFVCYCHFENQNAKRFYEKMGGRIIDRYIDSEEHWINSITYQFEV